MECPLLTDTLQGFVCHPALCTNHVTVSYELFSIIQAAPAVKFLSNTHKISTPYVVTDSHREVSIWFPQYTVDKE